MRRTAILIPGLICFSLLSWIRPVADAQTSGATVQVIDFEFTPRAVTVAVGAAVLWSWDGSEPHTVSARDGSFESGEKGRGAQFSFTFRTAGRFDYFCRVHPDLMTGTVTVQAAPPPSPSPRPKPTSAAPAPAPTSARPSPSRTSARPQPTPAPTSAKPAPTTAPIALSTPAAVAPAPSAVGSASAVATTPPATSPSVTSRSSAPLASLDGPKPKDRTGLAIALALLVAAAGIGLGTTLLMRGRSARKLSSPSP